MQLTILISLMGLVHCSYFAISRDFLRNYDRDDVDYISRLDEGDLEEFYTLVTKNSWPNIRHIDDSHLVMGEV